MADKTENKHKSEIENIMNRLKVAGVQSDERGALLRAEDRDTEGYNGVGLLFQPFLSSKSLFFISILIPTPAFFDNLFNF